MSLTDVAYQLQEYGPVAPSTAVEPIRYPQVRTTDGLGLEEGTTNLVTNPRLAVDATGWAGTSNTRVTNRGRTGSTSSRADIVAGGGPAAQIVITTASLAAGTAHTATFYTFQEKSLGATGASVLYIDVTGPGGFDSNDVAIDQTVIGRWQRTSVTFTPTTAGAHTVRLVTGGGAATGSVWVTDVQVEAKSYATSYADGSLGTGYAWTGTAHASTSTRAAGRIDHAIPTLPMNAVTLAAWHRVGNIQSSGYLMAVGTGGSEFINLQMSGTAIAAVKVTGGSITAVAELNLGLAVGDLLGAAAAYDGTTLSLAASKNGAAPQTTAAANSVIPAPATAVWPGSITGALSLNGGLEQVLVFDRALTLAEVTALATGGPRSMADDSGIVYAAAVPETRGTTNALTTAGAGRFRTTRSFAASLDANLPPLVTAPGSRRLSVPVGTGLGVGDLVRFGDRGYRVSSTYASGGQFDELIVLPFTTPYQP